jgi:hypothetical protein
MIKFFGIPTIYCVPAKFLASLLFAVIIGNVFSLAGAPSSVYVACLLASLHAAANIFTIA